MKTQGLIRCRSCGSWLQSTEFGRLHGQLHPSCLGCRRDIRNRSYHNKKLGLTREPTRSPLLYQFCAMTDAAVKMDLSRGASFRLLACNSRDQASPGELIAWAPKFELNGVSHSPALLLARFKGREALLNVERGPREPATFLLFLGAQIGEGKKKESGIQFENPPTVTERTEIINSSGKSCSLDEIRWRFVECGDSVESLAERMNLPVPVIAYLASTFGWNADGSNICTTERMANSEAVLERLAAIESLKNNSNPKGESNVEK